MKFGITHNRDLSGDLLQNVRSRVVRTSQLLKKGSGSRYVHEVRKELKKARAALRLLRKSLATDSFDRLDHTLQKTAKRLSPLRDAQALQKAVADLAKSKPNENAKLSLTKLHAAITRRFTKARLGQTKLKRCKRELRAAKRRIDGRKPSKLGWRELSHRVRQSYVEGKQAFQLAKSAPSFDSLHAWRKRTKTFWNQLRLLRRIHPRDLGRLVTKSGELGDALGEDHDLGMLEQLLPELELTPAEVKQLKRIINARRRRLQNASFKSGAVLYAGDASSFGRQIHKYGRQWSG